MSEHFHTTEHLPFHYEPSSGVATTEVYYHAFLFLLQKKNCIGRINKRSVEFRRNSL
jgi:hypothetical protein